MTPDQFWRMHPRELWWLIEAKRPPKRYGSLTEDEMESLHDDLEEQGFFNG